MEPLRGKKLTVRQALELAIQHHQAGRLQEAEALYRQVLSAEPNNPYALNLLGVLGAQVGKLEPGLACIRKAIAIKPDYLEAHNNLGCILAGHARPDEAIDAFKAALGVNPDHHAARSNLAAALLQCGRVEETIALFKEISPGAPGGAEVHSCYLMMLNFVSDDPVAIVAEQRRWNQLHAEPLRPFIRPHRNDASVGRRLRIGYVSADFNDHAAGRNLVPLLREHARDRFEIFCYSSTQRRSGMTDRFRGYANGWHDILGVADETAAQTIRDDGIDILVDLSLHSAGNRLKLFAHKPAPVQATFVGYPGGTGLEAIDYRLTDPFLDLPGIGDEYYVETSIRLANSFWCYDPDGMELSDVPPVSAVPAAQAGVVTFGCLNGLWKINEEVLALWAKVMAASAGSRAIMICPWGSARDRTAQKLASLGIETSRIEFVDRQSRPDYFKLFARIDIGLDTFPYNGHTTSLDSLWMGVPVVTLVGRTCVGRAGLSQLSNLDLTELVARSPEQFVAIATKLVQDLPRLAELRSSLRQRMLSSPIMDAPRFTRDVESACDRMWQKWCAERTISK